MSAAEPIVLVAGCARSGLTVTMQMLHAGGFPCAGPAPSFESFPIGGIPFDTLGGQAVKVVDLQRQYPPPGPDYRVIRLRRDPVQQILSTLKFVQVFQNAPPSRFEMKRMTRALERDLDCVDRWIHHQARQTLTLDFENIITNPRGAADVLAQFVGFHDHWLDRQAMAGVVRHRGTDCYPGLLELEMLMEAYPDADPELPSQLRK